MNRVGEWSCVNREVELGCVLTGRWWCCVKREGVLCEEGGGAV